MTPQERRELEVLHLLARHWEGLIRPSLRAQVALMERVHGRRPAPGELLVIAGPAIDVRLLVRPGLVVPEAGLVTAVVLARATGPREAVAPQCAGLLASLAATYPPETLVVAWVEGCDIDVVGLDDVVDTGPEGARINTPHTPGRPS